MIAWNLPDCWFFIQPCRSLQSRLDLRLKHFVFKQNQNMCIINISITHWDLRHCHTFDIWRLDINNSYWASVETLTSFRVKAIKCDGWLEQVFLFVCCPLCTEKSLETVFSQLSYVFNWLIQKGTSQCWFCWWFQWFQVSVFCTRLSVC